MCIFIFHWSCYQAAVFGGNQAFARSLCIPVHQGEGKGNVTAGRGCRAGSARSSEAEMWSPEMTKGQQQVLKTWFAGSQMRGWHCFHQGGFLLTQNSWPKVNSTEIQAGKANCGCSGSMGWGWQPALAMLLRLFLSQTDSEFWSSAMVKSVLSAFSLLRWTN